MGAVRLNAATKGASGDRMYAFERKDKTLLQLREQGRITVTREARRLGVSLATLRRDLEDLERQGLIQKVRGGAVLADAARFETHFEVRMKTAVAAKQHIARLAAETVKNDSSIFLDHSTSSVFLARALQRRSFRSLIVLTNSLAVPAELGEAKGVEILLTGGIVQHEFRALSGRRVVDALSWLNIHQAFVSVGAISVERGLMTQIPFIADIIPDVLRTAAQVNVLANSAKFVKVGAFQLGAVKPGLRVFSDPSLSRELRAGLEAAGVEVIV
jgi:DeoR family transcriptional regulator, fructose operon transcriptional repressor